MSVSGIRNLRHDKPVRGRIWWRVSRVVVYLGVAAPPARDGLSPSLKRHMPRSRRAR